MIIVSQDEETILNFKNVQEIRIEEYGTHIKGKKIYKIFSGNFEGYATLLGSYETKERVKEVLKEIIRVIEDNDIVNLMENLQISLHDPSFGGSLTSVYKMPKE